MDRGGLQSMRLQSMTEHHTTSQRKKKFFSLKGIVELELESSDSKTTSDSNQDIGSTDFGLTTHDYMNQFLIISISLSQSSSVSLYLYKISLDRWMDRCHRRKERKYPNPSSHLWNVCFPPIGQSSVCWHTYLQRGWEILILS